MNNKQAEQYYDEFSSWYENERGKGYHAFLDKMELGISRQYVEGKDVLEAGCGTGLILQGLDKMARRAVGVDISAGMLEKARARGLEVVKGSLTNLPFPDNSFDTTVSFKVLAHIPELELALREMARVTKPGGHMILEFYNKNSLRYLVKLLKPAHKVADKTFDTEVFTNYHSWQEVLSLLPKNVKPLTQEGIRIIAPTHHFYKLPLLGRLTETIEERASKSSLRKLGGFLIGVFMIER
jgi:ubiquinone/menaquinone biosynthesis C-methylase UbiE